MSERRYNVGQRWAYRERASDPDCPVAPVEILELNVPRQNNLLVRFLEGDLKGQERGVPVKRLLAPWDQREAWLRDERLLMRTREASKPLFRPIEAEAAKTIFYAYPLPNLVDFDDRGSAAIIRVLDLETVAKHLQIDPGELLAEPASFLDLDDQYVAPWPVALRLAKRIAERFPNEVVASIAEEEQELQHRAVAGWHFRGLERWVSVPAEECSADLRAKQPIYDLVREWCGRDTFERFDELQASRQVVARLRHLLKWAADRLEGAKRGKDAAWLREQLETSSVKPESSQAPSDDT